MAAPGDNGSSDELSTRQVRPMHDDSVNEILDRLHSNIREFEYLMEEVHEQMRHENEAMYELGMFMFKVQDTLKNYNMHVIILFALFCYFLKSRFTFDPYFPGSEQL